MDSKSLAKILYRMASSDRNPDGVGRLILSELKDAFCVGEGKQIRELTVQDIIILFHKFYPKVEVEQRTDNILLIWFEGKADTQNRRNVHKTVPPPEPTFAAEKDEIPADKYEDPDAIKPNKEKIWM